jgi:sarcosine oxidase subunit alpha
LTTVNLSPDAFPYLGVREGLVAGVPALLLRIGFVGELGYELHFPADYGEHLWRVLLEAGSPLRVRPFGVEAQRVLRLEKQLAIVSHDTDALTTPLDANLGWAVKLDKPDFIGRAAVLAARERGSDHRLVGFQMQGGRLLPGEGAAVVLDGQPVGRVTSSRWSAHLGKAIGLAWVPAQLARHGATFDVRVEGGSCPAQVVGRPFWDPDGKRLRQ